MVDARDRGQGRRFFHSQEEAQRFHDSLQLESALGETWWLSLPPTDRAKAIATLGEIHKAGADLDTVWSHWKSTVGTARRMTLRKAADEFLLSRERGRRVVEGTLVQYRSMLRRLCSIAGDDCPVALLTHDQLLAYCSADVPVTSRNRMLLVHAFISWCLKREYILRNPMRAIERPKVEHAPPQILTPREALNLCHACFEHTPRLSGWLVLGLWFGCRPMESSRADWSCTETEPLLTLDFTKLRHRRLVEPNGHAWAWLHAAGEAGAELPLTPKQVARLCLKLARVVGWDKWRRDILRHTCASYWLGATNDAALVSSQLGNSREVLYRHYRELVLPPDVRCFWRLHPDNMERDLRWFNIKPHEMNAEQHLEYSRWIGEMGLAVESVLLVDGKVVEVRRDGSVV